MDVKPYVGTDDKPVQSTKYNCNSNEDFVKFCKFQHFVGSSFDGYLFEKNHLLNWKKNQMQNGVYLYVLW